jgi:hypothetical protein
MSVGPITVGLAWDDAALLRRFSRTEKQFVFAVLGRDGALNTAAKLLQQVQFERVREKFTVRKPQFFFGSPTRPGGAAARITKFASVRDRLGQSSLYAEVAVRASSEAANLRLLLGLFEEGGTRRPFTAGAKRVAVPLPGGARPTPSSGIPSQLRFSALKFKPVVRGKRTTKRRIAEFTPAQRDGVQWKGQLRTFILKATHRSPEGGVFQRFGPKPGEIRELYAFEQPFKLDSRLHWIDTARSAAPAILHEAVQRALVDVITHNASKAS